MKETLDLKEPFQYTLGIVFLEYFMNFGFLACLWMSTGIPYWPGTAYSTEETFPCEKLLEEESSHTLIFQQLLKTLPDSALNEYFHLSDLSLKSLSYAEVSSSLLPLKNILSEMNSAYLLAYIKVAAQAQIIHQNLETNTIKQIESSGALKPGTSPYKVIWTEAEVLARQVLRFSEDSKRLIWAVHFHRRILGQTDLRTGGFRELPQGSRDTETILSKMRRGQSVSAHSHRQLSERITYSLFDTSSETRYEFTKINTGLRDIWCLIVHRSSGGWKVCDFDHISSEMEHFYFSKYLYKIVIQTKTKSRRDFYEINLDHSSGDPVGQPRFIFSVFGEAHCMDPSGKHILSLRHHRNHTTIEMRDLGGTLKHIWYPGPDSTLISGKYCEVSPDLNFIALDSFRGSAGSDSPAQLIQIGPQSPQ